MRLNRRLTLFLLMCIISLPFQLMAQKKSSTYERYISIHYHLAKEQQKKYRIPASVTLAQALLESGAGRAQLARKSNNHFGIKCHKEWKGKRAYHQDEKPNECFRAYARVADSYEDHSLFLTQRSRYEPLFKLRMTDYRGWAKGLQKCGYATDRAYANKLIKLIEDYRLYEYDEESKQQKPAPKTQKKPTRTAPKKQQPAPVQNRRQEVKPAPRDIFKTYGLIYVVARYNDSFQKIAHDLGFTERDLLKYNEVPAGFPLRVGDVVYLEMKKRKADKPHYLHQVQIGESMHGISQKYGVRIKSLYRLNGKDADYIPEEGDLLKLR